MVFSLVIASVLSLVVLRQFGVSLPNWIRAAVYGAIVIGLATQAITLTNVQNRRSARLSRERDEAESIKESSA
jgi:multisubunit Na+/H+ antiporter MnhC subunit